MSHEVVATKSSIRQRLQISFIKGKAKAIRSRGFIWVHLEKDNFKFINSERCKKGNIIIRREVRWNLIYYCININISNRQKICKIMVGNVTNTIMNLSKSAIITMRLEMRFILFLVMAKERKSKSLCHLPLASIVLLFVSSIILLGQ